MPEIGYVTGPDSAARTGLPPGLASLRFFLRNGGSQVVAVEVRDETDATYQVVLDENGTEQR